MIEHTSAPGECHTTALTKTIQARYGLVSFRQDDTPIGRSFEVYGEWAQHKVNFLLELIRPGDAVCDVGANIGSYTLAFAQAVGASGQVYAFEWQSEAAEMLHTNIKMNGCRNVRVVGPSRGLSDVSLDRQELVSCSLINIPVENTALDVIKRAQRTLQSFRPLLYVECLKVGPSWELVQLLRLAEYKAYIHRTAVYNSDNFFRNAENIYGLADELNILFVPVERDLAVQEICGPKLTLITDLDCLGDLIFWTLRCADSSLRGLSRDELVALCSRLRGSLATSEQERATSEQRANELQNAVFELKGELSYSKTTQEFLRGRAQRMENEQLHLVRQLEQIEGELSNSVCQARDLAQELLVTRARLAECDSVLLAITGHDAERLVVNVSDYNLAKRLFDPHFYLDKYPDVAATKIDPLAHYLQFGWLQGRKPHPLFDPTFYVHRYSTQVENRNPLLHFLQEGGFQGFDPSPLFCTAHYLNQVAEVDCKKDIPLLHFLQSAPEELRDPHPLFSVRYYLDQHVDVRDAGTNPLLHFVLFGAPGGRATHPLFDTAYYLKTNRSRLTSDANPLIHYLEKANYDCVPHPLFDVEFYRNRHPEAAEADANPLLYFLEHGTLLQQSPHPLFDTSYYLKNNPEVAMSGLNPLVHFLLAGAAQAADPNPVFDMRYYLDRNPDVAAAGVNPLMHYLESGAAQGRSPHPLFDPEYYREQLGDNCVDDCNLLSHFLTQGGKEGLSPGPLFDSAHYLTRYRDVAAARLNPLLHYLEWGATEGRSPNAIFEADYYRKQVPELTNDVNPLIHYVKIGAAAGLDPAREFDTSYYLQLHPDLLKHRLNPLAHYLKYHPKLARPARFVYEEVLGTLTAYDRLRMDGKPVILFVSHNGGGGTGKHVRELTQALEGQCHIMLLAPADHLKLGPLYKGFVELSAPALESSLPLTFDPIDQIEDMILVARALGVARVHVHHLMGNEQYLEEFIKGLGVPFDLTIHDYYLLSPQPHLTDEKGRFVGEPNDDKTILLRDHPGYASIGQWREEHAWLIHEAHRVIVPSVDTEKRLSHYFPRQFIVASHPLQPGQYPTVEPHGVSHDEDLRIAVIGASHPAKGIDLVEQCAVHAKAQGLPLRFYLLGETCRELEAYPDSALILLGHYQNNTLPDLLDQIAPHLAWFPSLCPETFSYTLSEALDAKLPIVTSDLGALAERVDGRQWTWVERWDMTSTEWCDFFVKIRYEHFKTKRGPAPPSGRGGTARSDFYPTAYLEPMSDLAELGSTLRQAQ